jgi:tetratricopeptide (TPR) repeat protein
MPVSQYPPAPALEHLTDKALRSRLVNLRESVAPILANNALLHFTDHSVNHSDNLAKFLDDLIRPLQSTPQRLTQDELFIVYAACYLHDIGMQFEKAYETQVISDLNLKTSWNDIPLEEQQKIIRQNHAAISAEMMRDSVNAQKPIVGIQLTMDYFPNYVAAISEGHTLPIESPRYRALTVDGPNLRIELLSGLLRIADILDLSRRRANRAKALTLALSLESQTHWWRHHYTEDIVIDQNTKLVSVWFDFPPTHANEYRKVVPQIQMPWIEAEFQRQSPVFHRYGLGWSVGSVISDRADSIAEPMPDSVLAEMLKQLYLQLKRDEEQHSQMVVKLFEDAQPHIDRRIAELEARRGTISPGEYLREASRIASDLREIGAVRTALQLLTSGDADSEKELAATERLAIAAQRAVLMREDGDTTRAFETLRALVPLADSLPDGNFEKFLFWKTWANSLVDAFAYEPAIAALNRAIALATSQQEKDALSVRLAEIQFLLGNVQVAFDTSSDSVS